MLESLPDTKKSMTLTHVHTELQACDSARLQGLQTGGVQMWQHCLHKGKILYLPTGVALVEKCKAGQEFIYGLRKSFLGLNAKEVSAYKTVLDLFLQDGRNIDIMTAIYNGMKAGAKPAKPAKPAEQQKEKPLQPAKTADKRANLTGTIGILGGRPMNCMSVEKPYSHVDDMNLSVPGTRPVVSRTSSAAGVYLSINSSTAFSILKGVLVAAVLILHPLALHGESAHGTLQLLIA